MAECGKFSRENLKKLPLPEALKDYVQLGDLGDGLNLDEIVKESKTLLENVDEFE